MPVAAQNSDFEEIERRAGGFKKKTEEMKNAYSEMYTVDGQRRAGGLRYKTSVAKSR